MSYLSQQKMLAAGRKRQLIQGRHVATPTFGESFQNAFDETTEMELFTSRKRLVDRHTGWQKDYLTQLHETGEIPDDVWAQSVKTYQHQEKMDWEGLAAYANENLGTDIDVSWGYVAARALEDTQARQKIQSTYNAFTPQGVASFLGTAAAMFNPASPADFVANVALSWTPQGVATRSAMRNVVNVAARESAAGLVAEGLTQTSVYHLRKDIGDDYQVSDAVANVLASMVVQGAIGGAISVPSSINRAKHVREMSEKALRNADAADLREAVDALVARIEKREADGSNVLSISMLPKRKPVYTASPEEAKAAVIKLAIEDLTPLAGEALSRGEVKALTRELNDLRYRQQNVPDGPSRASRETDTKYKSKRRQKIEDQRRGDALAKQQREELQEKIDAIERKLERNDEARAARSELSRAEAGEIPETYRGIFEDELAIIERKFDSEEVEPGFDIMGPTDPLTPQQRASLEDLRLMRTILEELDFTKSTMSAAEAQKWLETRWNELQLLEVDTALPETRARATVDRAARRSETMTTPGVEKVDLTAANRALDDAVPTGPQSGDTVTRLVRNPSTGEMDMVTTSWDDIAKAERDRLAETFKQIDNARACIMG